MLIDGSYQSAFSQIQHSAFSNQQFQLILIVTGRVLFVSDVSGTALSASLTAMM